MSVTQVKPFPEVDEASIAKAAAETATARTSFRTAARKVGALEDSTSWRSPDARPSWDTQLRLRAADLAAAGVVMDHFHDVLTTAATQVGRYRDDYDAAVRQLQWLGPHLPSDPSVPSLVPGPDGAPWTPPTQREKDQYAADLAVYNRAVQHINDIADSAELCLALCAAELLELSQGVTFADPLPVVGTDPLSELLGGSISPILGPDGRIQAVFPLVPAWGAPQGAIFANGVPVQFPKGKAFEASVLRSLGISAETKQLFRPDATGSYNLPRLKSGVYRGTFPDSLRLGVLEIKSGTTPITASTPQIRIQLWVARTLGRPFNLIASRDTPVDPKLLAAAQRTGGSVYTRVSDNVFYDRNTGEYVRLRGGPPGNGTRTPLTPSEVEEIPRALRDASERSKDKEPPDPPGGTGGTGGGAPADDYVTSGEYDDAWADVDEDGVRHMQAVPGPGSEQPGVPQLPGGPIVPVVPLPGPVPLPAPGPLPVFPGGGLIPLPIP